MKTIGIIGGMSWTSSSEYYRLLNRFVHERLGGSHSAKLVLWSVDFGEHLAIHEHGGWDAVADEAIDIAGKLQAAGADFLLMAVNTLHRVADRVEAAVDLPLLHIADATGDELVAAGLSRVGLLGTRHTMYEDFYRARLQQKYGVEVLVPEPDDGAKIDHIIFEELVVDRYDDAARRTCLRVMDRLIAKNAQAIVLACTELPRLVADVAVAVPTFDTLASHARAAVDLALR
jgi:aspartate racemase